MWLLRSPVNPKPCGTFSWPSSKSPFSPFSMAAKSLLLPKPRGKKKHSKTSWSSSFPSESRGLFSPLQNHMDLYLSTCFRASWFSHLLQSRVVSSSLLKPCGPPHYFEAVWSLLPFRAAWSLLLPPKPCGPPYYFWSRVVSSSYGCRA